jgi:hypothetical protein
MSKIGTLLLMVAFIIGCTQIKPIGNPSSPAPEPAPPSNPAPIGRPSEPPPPLSPKRDWKSGLAVPPGTSLEEGEEQIIRLVSKKDFREFEGKFWVAGKGFAMINGAQNVYFWGSAKPPQLEVEVSDRSKGVFDACRKIVRSDFKNDQMLYLEGEGFFEEVQTPKGFLGIFKVFKISKCRLGSPKDFNKNLN